MRISTRLQCTAALGVLATAGWSHAAAPVVQTWSNLSTGPDGPWNALQLVVDGVLQTDVTLGGFNASSLSERSSSVISIPGSAAPAVSIVVDDTASTNASVLSLGQPSANTSLAAALYAAGAIPSRTLGFHLGSAPWGLPGSLVYGGYDRARLLGPVYWHAASSFAPPGNGTFLTPTLSVISIGTELGFSAFSFSQNDGVAGAAFAPYTPVALDPSTPYLHLPRGVCDSLARYLPVAFDDAQSVYRWNTTDARYAPLITSGNFLGFNFTGNASGVLNQQIMIPFPLLNLTLDGGAAGEAYFPCKPSAGEYVLGRAFLQAAYIGLDYDAGWWMAQATGPNVAAADVVPLLPGQRDVSNNGGKYTDTWTGRWKPLTSQIGGGGGGGGAASLSAAATAGGGGGGLSPGAQAGVGVGVAVAALAVLGAAGFVWWSRRKSASRRRGEAAAAAEHVAEMGSGGSTVDAEKDGKEVEATLEAGGREMHEVDAHEVFELPGDMPAAAELDGADSKG